MKGFNCNYIILASILTVNILHVAIATKEKRCVVCQQVMKEIVAEVKKVDPRKTVQVGSYRIEPDGSQKQNSIKYQGSKLHYDEIFETVCDRMSEYAQVRHKETRKLAILNLANQINELPKYDILRDPDLNRGLKFYCETIIEEFEDEILEIFLGSEKLDPEEASQKLCWQSSGYCYHGAKEEDLAEEDYHTEF